MTALDKQHPLYQEDLTYILSTQGIEQLCHKSLLITGATGLTGTLFIDALMLYNQQGADITIYAMGRSKKNATARLGEYFDDEHFHFIKQDAIEPLPGLLRVDYIVPLASNTHPLAYSQYPIETIEINVLGAIHALQKAKECNATVLYPSTVEVYGNARGEDTFTEDYTGNLNLSNSRSCYTESKRVCEALCQSYIAEHGLTIKIARMCRVFGPTMLPTDTKASSQFLMKALNGEDIVLKSNGEQYFSYIYAADAVTALLHILLFGRNGTAYNISSDKCNIHLRDFAQYCADWAKREVVLDLPDEIESKGFSIAQQAILDNSRLIELGWHPQHDIRDALTRTLQILNNDKL